MDNKKNTGKKQLPKFDPKNLTTDYFSSSSNVILESVSKSAEEITALHEKEEKSQLEEVITDEQPEPEDKIQPSILDKKKESRGEGAVKANIVPKKPGSSRKIKEKKNDNEDFLYFLAEGRSRRNTQPVRIKKQNYDRIIELRDYMGGSKSIPEIVDKILEMYLDQVEKQMERS